MSQTNMLQGLDNLFRFHQTALNLRAYRQQLLAANIANADTPNFKARDIDFQSALEGALAGRGTGAVLSTTSGNHLPSGAQSEPAAVLYRSALQPGIDNNSVDMDVERNRFAENAVHYEAGLAFLNSQIRLMSAALQG